MSISIFGRRVLSVACVAAALATTLWVCMADNETRTEVEADRTLLKAGIVSVVDFGARLDGKTDDAPAIQKAFNSLKRGGKATGTLVIPGYVRIASTLDFDGGYRNTTNEDQWNAGHGENLRIEVNGALRPDANIGVAVHLHGARDLWADIRFDGGGADNDVALLVEDLDESDIGVTADKFAGTVLKADATGDNKKRLRSCKMRHVFATNCGQAIEWRGIEAFGPFQFIWDRNCKRGSHFFRCADIGIGHYENFSPDTQTIGLHFEECNMFNVGVITMGDRAKEALVQITGGDFGSIQRLRATGRPDAPKDTVNTTEGLRLVNVKSLNIDNLHTAKCKIGLHAIGSTFSVGRHQSMTGDVNPLVIEGSQEYPSSWIDIDCWYHYHGRESVKIADSVKGGLLRLHGQSLLMNVENTRNEIYAIDCRSKEMLLDVSGLDLEMTPARGLKGAIYHESPQCILGVSRAHIEGPVVHGQAVQCELKVNQTIRNSSPQTLRLYVPVRLEPAGAAAWAKAFVGATDKDLLPAAVREVSAGAPTQTDTLQITVPPWWFYRLEAQNATPDKATAILE